MFTFGKDIRELAVEFTSLIEIKGFSQCIAANKQQACGLAAAASCAWLPLVSFSYAN